ncbi:MAG: serpin family protein [Chlamydiae bacterium]|nr:serpin family protein [Chlamydiota bacterium]
MRLKALATALITLSTSLCLNTLCAEEEEPDPKLDVKLASSINDFAFSMNRDLMKDSSSSTLFSPYSLFTTLSLLHAGARAETAAEIAKALSLKLPAGDLSDQIAKYQKQLKPSKTDSFSLKTAGALWMDRDSYILSDFRHIAEGKYDGKVESLNFADEEKSRSIVNEWIANQTGGKIPTLLQMGDITPLTRLLITSALFFEGSFQKPFDPKNTKASPFTTESGLASVMMMEQTAFFPYYESEKLQMIALPFKGVSISGSQIACLIILPQKTSSLSQVTEIVTSFSFKEWMGALDMRNVHVKVPKFTVNCRNDLSDLLQKMGMQIAFTTKANFSGIDGMQDLFLSKVLHQAYFLLDEKGACAAAATAAAMNVTSAGPSAEAPLEFLADHPFLFALVDITTNTLLFLGSYTQAPTVGEP